MPRELGSILVPCSRHADSASSCGSQSRNFRCIARLKRTTLLSHGLIHAHEYSLDALNFFLADVRQGLGPYLAIYLLTERHWAEDRIGFAMTIATVSGLIAETPAGALTDISHA
jgi:hypothetical protein